MRPIQPRTALVPALLAAAFSAHDALAADHTVAAGSSQRPLVVRVDGGSVVARACAEADLAKCDPTVLGVTLRLPNSARAGAPRATVEDLALDGGKHVALVRVPGPSDRELVVIVASTSRRADAPQVVYSGWSHPRELEITRGDGGARVTFSTRSELCGRDVLVRVRALDAAKLTVVESPGPDPLAGRRAGATRAHAKVVSGEASKPSLPILVARGASSGRAALAVDGDPKTAWTEDEPGSGARAWMSFAAPADVPVTGLEVRIGAAPADVGNPRAPRAFTVVTDTAVVAVDLPEDAGAKGGAVFEVPFSTPIRTRCVALVVDDVYPPAKGATRTADPTAYVHEVSAHTELDGASLDDVAARLSGRGPEKAKLELAVLSQSGEAGIAAVTRAYPQLDGPGRDAARRVIDTAGCDAKLALYVPLLADHDTTEVDRARDRIRRCGKMAGPTLLAAMRAAVGPSRDVYAEEAALVAPEVAVPELVTALVPLGVADSEARRAVRHALGKALVRTAGRRVFDEVLAAPTFTEAPLVARVDTLRAMGEAIGESKVSSAAFSSVSEDARAFRERYLLLAPAGDLGRSSDAVAAKFLAKALADGDLRIRARATEVARGIPALQPAIVAAIDDPEMRVRRAALDSLAHARRLDAGGASRVLERLQHDGWTPVRLAAAGALRFAPPGDPVDRTLGAAVDFETSPRVRAEMVLALGDRGARSQTSVVSARAEDTKEALEVRLAAVRALGTLCDPSAIDVLTDLALRGRAPVYEADRQLSVGAIGSLARLAPADLDARLAPLRDERVPGDIRDVLKGSLAQRGGCRATPAASRGK